MEYEGGGTQNPTLLCHDNIISTFWQGKAVRLQVFFGEFVRLLYFFPLHVPLINV